MSTTTAAAAPIQWSTGYELGVQDIDLQHHYFANLINRLAVDLKVVDDPALRVSLVSELNAYARFHFISEENLMQRAGYPELDEHRAHHRRLIDELSHRESRLIMKNSPHEAEAVLAFLVQWFLVHTMQEDRLFADFVHASPG